jgi:hypothetical protein
VAPSSAQIGRAGWLLEHKERDVTTRAASKSHETDRSAGSQTANKEHGTWTLAKLGAVAGATRPDASARRPVFLDDVAATVLGGHWQAKVIWGRGLLH